MEAAGLIVSHLEAMITQSVLLDVLIESCHIVLHIKGMANKEDP